MNLLDQLKKSHIEEIANNIVKNKDAESAKDEISMIQERFRERSKRFSIGDLVKVYVKIVEGKRERIQTFEGYVITMKGEGLSKTFKVRKISFGVGVERTFPLYSPSIDRIDLIRRGRVRRAKLYYLRQRKGKKAAIKEKINYKSK